MAEIPLSASTLSSETLKCDSCNYTCKWIPKLHAHIRKVHSEDKGQRHTRISPREGYKCAAKLPKKHKPKRSTPTKHVKFQPKINRLKIKGSAVQNLDSDLTMTPTSSSAGTQGQEDKIQFDCDQCDSKFGSKRSRRRHVASQHKSKTKSAAVETSNEDNQTMEISKISSKSEL